MNDSAYDRVGAYITSATPWNQLHIAIYLQIYIVVRNAALPSWFSKLITNAATIIAQLWASRRGNMVKSERARCDRSARMKDVEAGDAK